MPADSNVLYLTALESFDLVPLDFNLTMLPGRVCVQKQRTEQTDSGILLPQYHYGSKVETSVGVVAHVGYGDYFASKADKDQGIKSSLSEPTIKRGDIVLYRNYDGAWFEDFQETGASVRMFGVGNAWDDSIVARVTRGQIEPLYPNWTFIERDLDESPIIATLGGYKRSGKDVHTGKTYYWGATTEVLTFKFGKIPESYALVATSDLLAYF